MSKHAFSPRYVYNPFYVASAEASSASPSEVPSKKDLYVSESSLKNTDIGVCPKCCKPMTRAIIHSGEPVFYCETDRVSMPLPDELLVTP